MGISGKFIFLLIAGFTVPILAIFTNLDDWLNNRQNLELFKERKRYHDLGKSFESLFNLYLDGIHELGMDYSKALHDKYLINQSKGKSFSKINTDPEYWLNGYNSDQRFYAVQYKNWNSSQKAKFLKENLPLKNLFDQKVKHKIVEPASIANWETESPLLIQIFAFEKNLTPGKPHTAKELAKIPVAELKNLLNDFRIQPLLHHSIETNQFLWDAISGLTNDFFQRIIQPKQFISLIDQLSRFLGASFDNFRGQRLPGFLEVVEFEISINTVPQTFDINAFTKGLSEEEVPDCLVVHIILLQKARNRFLNAWLKSDLETLFNRLDPTNKLNWKTKLTELKSHIKLISLESDIVFFDPAIQQFSSKDVVTLEAKKLSLNSLIPKNIEYIYGDNGEFGMNFTYPQSGIEETTNLNELIRLASTTAQNVDFNGSFNSNPIIGSFIGMHSLPSTAFLIFRNSDFLVQQRFQDVFIFVLLMIFLALVSLIFYFLLHDRLVTPVTTLSDAVLKIRPGLHVNLNSSSVDLNHELRLLNTEFEDLQDRMNLDFDAMQLSRRLLAVCSEDQSIQIRPILAEELAKFLECQAVCLTLYKNGLSRRSSDYTLYHSNQSNISDSVKLEWLKEIQEKGQPEQGLTEHPGNDDFPCTFQLHLIFDSESEIGALIRMYDPKRVDLIKSGRLEMLMVQLIPSLIRQEINELNEEQQIGSELQSRFQISHIQLSQLDYDQVYMPARSLAGDALLSWQSSDKLAIYVAIGDAAGKGVGPSLYAATCISLIRPMSEDLKTPEKILGALNNSLCEYQSSEMFLTFFLARISLENYSIQFASAGHNQMLLCKANGDFEELSCKGIPLGLMPDYQYKLGHTSMEPYDRLFMYTDGVTEAEDIYQKLFGKERLLALLSQNKKQNSKTTLQSIKKNILDFSMGLESSDDITMISLLRTV